MEAFATPSASPSHYSKEAIGFAVGAGALFLVLCIGWAYIHHHHGGPTKMLRVRREYRESKRKACDIEMAEAADKADRVAVQEYKKMMTEKKTQEANKQARDMIEAVEKGNDLVGTMPKPPQCVDLDEELRPQQKEFDEKLCAERTKQLHVKEGKVVVKDSLDLAIDPISCMVGSGKDMAVLYSK